MYAMGRHSIQKGSEDTWTITPKRIVALNDAAKAAGFDPAAAVAAVAAVVAGRGGAPAPLVPHRMRPWPRLRHPPQARAAVVVVAVASVACRRISTKKFSTIPRSAIPRLHHFGRPG